MIEKMTEEEAEQFWSQYFGQSDSEDDTDYSVKHLSNYFL